MNSQMAMFNPVAEAPADSNPSLMLQEKRWWTINLFRGMVNDVKRRAPFYSSDWKDAWDYRVIPATVYMYFAKYGPKSTR